MTDALDPATIQALEEALGCRQTRVEPAAWGFKNRTWFVGLADGRDVVLQTYADRGTARRRADITRSLGAGTELPVPRMVACDLDARSPWAVVTRLPGRSGYEVAGPDLGGATWPSMAASMGRVVCDRRRIDVSAVDLPLLWTDPDALAAASNAWSHSLTSYFEAPSTAARVATIVDAIPSLLAGTPVVCHGDLGPQNVLFEAAEVSGLLDLEDVRLGPPLLDVAWWNWLVRAHTPVAFDRSWGRFVSACGDGELASTDSFELHALIVLRLLETADTFHRTDPEKHPSWARRIEVELDAFDRRKAETPPR